MALTLYLVIAALTQMMGLSLALGAFVGGPLLGSCPDAHNLAAKTFPIRDAFVALFFVTSGMLIDPRAWLSNWGLLALIVGLILVGKFVKFASIADLLPPPTPSCSNAGSHRLPLWHGSHATRVPS